MNKIMIVGGEFGGRSILTPGGATHPMGSRERLALFNMLAGRVEGAMVLDIYAGSGALGIEALSRGAKSATCVEKNSPAVQISKTSLDRLSVGDRAKVIRGVVPAVVSNLSTSDIVLADPPYDDFKIGDIEAIAQLVGAGGLLVLSHPGKAPELPGLELDKTRSYAGANLSIYQKKSMFNAYASNT